MGKERSTWLDYSSEASFQRFCLSRDVNQGQERAGRGCCYIIEDMDLEA